MKHMERKYKKADAMLRPEHESTLEKDQKKRMARRSTITKAYEKWEKKEEDPTLDK